jgi:hypothetical protein
MLLLSAVALFGLSHGSGSGGEVAATSVDPGALPRIRVLKEGEDQDIATLSFLVGQRSLESDGWEPNEDQFTIGLEFDSYRVSDWFGLDAGFHYADDDSGGGFGQTTEVFLGARKTFAIGKTGLHPYAGAGLAHIWTVNGVASGPTILADTDSSFGFYLRGGLYYSIANIVNVGADLRALLGTDISDSFGTDSADYFQFALTVGYSF